MNTEFQRIARKDREDFLSEQCKEIEENNRMENTRDVFMKIRDTKGNFHSETGKIKDRNGMDLTEAEGTKKKWQKYTEELYNKDLHDPGNQDGVITHLEPDSLEYEVKLALQIITLNKANRSHGIPVELFHILKNDGVKCCTQYCSKFRKLNSGHRTGKGEFSFQSQRMLKLLHYFTHLTLS